MEDKINIHKSDGYSLMSNHHFKDKELSLKAKGLLSLMFSLPNDWDYSIAGLTSLSSDGESTVRNALDELREKNYLTITRPKRDNGTFGKMIYDVYEYPLFQPLVEKPQVDKPQVEKPHVENQAQYITKELITKELITKEYEEEYKEEKLISKEETMFNKFWELYPKKVDRKGSLLKFIKIDKLENEFPLIMDSLQIYIKCDQWKNKQFIPHPTTFINQERWKSVDDIGIKNEDKIDCSDF